MIEKLIERATTLARERERQLGAHYRPIVDALLAKGIALPVAHYAAQRALGGDEVTLLGKVRDYIRSDEPLSPIAKLAERLGCTQTALSEAMRALEQEGLVRKRRVKGAPAFVTRWTRVVRP